MTFPDALGIRLYNAALSFDLWVTSQVDDFQFRSGVPGGFLDGSFKFRRYTPIGQPDVTIWTPVTSATSVDNVSFKVTDGNAAPITIGDRFWVYNSSGNIRMNGDRFTVTGKSSSGGITTVSYVPSSGSNLINSGDTVIAKTPASFYDTTLTGFNLMINLFNRIQVVDLRTMEIPWEGRIEEPARESGKDTWTLGCLGNSVFASDVQRPMFYLDDQPDSWHMPRFPDNVLYAPSRDDSAGSLTVTFGDGWAYDTHGTDWSWLRETFSWQQVEACDLDGVGRFDYVGNGADNATVSSKLGATIGAMKWDGSQPLTPVSQYNVGSYLCNAAANTHISRFVGSHLNYPTKRLYMSAGYIATSGAETVAGSSTYVTFDQIRVQGVRMDRFRNRLVTAASYPGNYLSPGDIVEDILGRFLNGGWDRNYADLPYKGYVDPYDAYIDKTSTIEMVSGWTFFDGVTAKELLDKMVTEAQTTAYWAIWESKFNATDSTFDAKGAFEFTEWPLGWGYLLTSEDGLTEQPNGSTTGNMLWYQYSWAANEVPGYKHIQTYWQTSNLQSDLNRAEITRGVFLRRDQSVDNSNPNIFNEASDYYNDVMIRTNNSGSIKVSRPVYCYDPGINRGSGMARMLDPWMIRPGKLAKIIDLEPPCSMNEFSFGNTAPSLDATGTIFRIPVVEYDSSTNTATLDLDEPQTWNVPNQISNLKPKNVINPPLYR